MNLDKLNQKQREVIHGVGALATSYDQTASKTALSNWYEWIDETLETEAQKEAFEEGALALMYGIGNIKPRTWFHSCKFHRLLSKVGA